MEGEGQKNTIDFRRLLGDAKFYDSFARRIPEQGEYRYETWGEAVERVMDMHRRKFADEMSSSSRLKEIFERIGKAYKNKLILGSQRGLQYGGEQIEKHNARLYNCAYTYADRPAFFGELLYCLLCGTGVGFSVQRQHVGLLPAVEARSDHVKVHYVADSIEGWSDALDVLMSSYFVSGGKHPTYQGRRVHFDFGQVRPRGSAVSGGMIAPGPDGLRNSLVKIERHLETLLTDCQKGDSVRLRPIDVYDICMHASNAVLSGGVRRSATICLFSPDDMEMRNAKTGDWLQSNPQRARSNNSAVLVKGKFDKNLLLDIGQSIRQFGEPGFVFVDNPDIGFNPCGEIALYPQIDGATGVQFCNLTEINGPAGETKEIFLEQCRTAAWLGTLQAAYTKFKFLGSETKRICDREALLGVSITGWYDRPELFDGDLLKAGARAVRKANRELAKLIGINPAARTTCVKPAGTTSILLGTASGIHPEHSARYIRNVQMNRESKVAKLLLETNPHMLQKSSWSSDMEHSDYVASFPVVSPETASTQTDLTALEHLRQINLVQKTWVRCGTNPKQCAIPNIEHNVSNTVTVDDWYQVLEYLYENHGDFGGVSMVPVSTDKIYNQAPNVSVLSASEMVERYGEGSLFASGLIVDGMRIFGHDLWCACRYAIDWCNGNLSTEQLVETYGSDDVVRRNDWSRRFVSFAERYFRGEKEFASMCLKEVHVAHRFNSIRHKSRQVDWTQLDCSTHRVSIDTLAAQACNGDQCEL